MRIRTSRMGLGESPVHPADGTIKMQLKYRLYRATKGSTRFEPHKANINTSAWSMRVFKGFQWNLNLIDLIGCSVKVSYTIHDRVLSIPADLTDNHTWSNFRKCVPLLNTALLFEWLLLAKEQTSWYLRIINFVCDINSDTCSAPGVDHTQSAQPSL